MFAKRLKQNPFPFGHHMNDDTFLHSIDRSACRFEMNALTNYVEYYYIKLCSTVRSVSMHLFIAENKNWIMNLFISFIVIYHRDFLHNVRKLQTAGELLPIGVMIASAHISFYIIIITYHMAQRQCSAQAFNNNHIIFQVFLLSCFPMSRISDRLFIHFSLIFNRRL